MGIDVKIGGEVVDAEVVRSFWKKTKGLMFRKSMGEGMLFVFSRPKTLDFWMMFMKFPIDIVFMDGMGKAVAVHHSASPTLNPFGRLYSSGRPAKYALELPAGFYKKHGIKEGTVALIRL